MPYSLKCLKLPEKALRNSGWENRTSRKTCAFDCSFLILYRVQTEHGGSMPRFRPGTAPENQHQKTFKKCLKLLENFEKNCFEMPAPGAPSLADPITLTFSPSPSCRGPPSKNQLSFNLEERRFWHLGQILVTKLFVKFFVLGQIAYFKNSIFHQGGSNMDPWKKRM